MERFEEKTLEADDLKLGECVAQIFYDSQGVPTYKIARVENVSPDLRIITAGLIRYGRDGWQYSKVDRLSSRIVQLTPEIDYYVRKKALVDFLSGVIWANEEMLTLEAVFHSYQSLRGRLG